MAKHKFDRVEYEARKTAKQELKNINSSNINSVSALRKRMALIEIALGIK